jgi:hypothetical protein
MTTISKERTLWQRVIETLRSFALSKEERESFMRTQNEIWAVRVLLLAPLFVLTLGLCFIQWLVRPWYVFVDYFFATESVLFFLLGVHQIYFHIYWTWRNPDEGAKDLQCCWGLYFFIVGLIFWELFAAGTEGREIVPAIRDYLSSSQFSGVWNYLPYIGDRGWLIVVFADVTVPYYMIQVLIDDKPFMKSKRRSKESSQLNSDVTGNALKRQELESATKQGGGAGRATQEALATRQSPDVPPSHVGQSDGGSDLCNQAIREIKAVNNMASDDLINDAFYSINASALVRESISWFLKEGDAKRIPADFFFVPNVLELDVKRWKKMKNQARKFFCVKEERVRTEEIDCPHFDLRADSRRNRRF